MNSTVALPHWGLGGQSGRRALTEELPVRTRAQALPAGCDPGRAGRRTGRLTAAKPGSYPSRRPYQGPENGSQWPDSGSRHADGRSASPPAAREPADGAIQELLPLVQATVDSWNSRVAGALRRLCLRLQAAVAGLSGGRAGVAVRAPPAQVRRPPAQPPPLSSSTGTRGARARRRWTGRSIAIWPRRGQGRPRSPSLPAYILPTAQRFSIVIRARRSRATPCTSYAFRVRFLPDHQACHQCWRTQPLPPLGRPAMLDARNARGQPAAIRSAPA